MKRVLLFSLVALLLVAIALPAMATGSGDSGSNRSILVSGEVLQNALGVATTQVIVGVDNAVETNANLLVGFAVDLEALAGTTSKWVPTNMTYECPGKVASATLRGNVLENARGILTAQLIVGNYNSVQANVNVVVPPGFF